MATVYRAHDSKLECAAAVKILSPELTPLLGPERFLQEIRITAGLRHPCIVPVFDSGQEEGLFYFVMPVVPGETLRERLRREQQLPIADALRIARDILEALGHAHEHGFIHRDVKPENIMLTEGRAVVTDFGIARAIDEAGGERITSSGLAVGTPAYMSPEQADGGPLDGRADLYAVACVLYEMLGGEPPFLGPTPQAILARQMQEAPRSLRIVRPTVPPALQEVIERGLAKVPADRFPTAAAFAAALSEALIRPDTTHVQRRLRVSLLLLAVLSVAAGGSVAVRSRLRSGIAPADTTRFVIYPVLRRSGDAPPFDESQLLRDAFARWQGVQILDAALVAEALGGRSGPVTPRAALQAARALGAGRYVVTEVSPVGDSLRVHAALFATAERGRQLADTAVRIGREVRGVDTALAALADNLLLRRPPSRLIESGGATTRSLAAQQAFLSGIAAVEQWDLAAAESALAEATVHDPGHVRALLWVAIVRWWEGVPTAAWRSASARALAGVARLPPREAELATALGAIAEGRTEDAGARLRRLAQRDSNAFAAWYALAACLHRDTAVVRDGRSPSGWRFRSSYHAALAAYQRALILLPSIHRAFRRDPAMRHALMTSARQMRSGRAAAPDTQRFRAHPSWLGDSLAFIPYPTRDFDEGRAWTVPTSRERAVRHQQQIFREVATAWSAAFPESPDALEALALSLELLGDAASLDTLRRARRLAERTDDATRLAASEVWLQLKFAAPTSPTGVAAARALADSLLRAHPPSRGVPEPLLLASLAGLTGRADLAAAYGRQPGAGRAFGLPPALAAHVLPLLSYAALGGPVDSISAQEDRAERAFAAASGSAAADARSQWRTLAATVAFPRVRLRALDSLAGSGDYLVEAELAFARGDRAASRSVLERVREARRTSRAADLTPDALYPEAWLLDAAGDAAAAAAWLDPTLAALGVSPPQSFADPVSAAALVHAMALRADAGARAGDTVRARDWARAVSVLWSDADTFLQPVVERARRIVR
jgi:hypothetical protein